MITSAFGKALRASGATGLVVAGMWLTTAIPAHAQVAGNQNQYSLTAEGDGELYSVTNAQLPAATTEEVSPYSSEAANDSSGNSSAFAGLPYPGPVGATIEGTVNGLSGGATPPIPPAPGFVSTTYPGSPTADESQGPYVVKATSSQYQSSAQAGFGISPNAGSADSNQQAYSRATVTANADGTVVATASAGVDAISIGGILDALKVGSTATLTGNGTSPPVLTASSDLGTFQVLGFKIGITQSGFDVAGASLPLPTGQVLAEVSKVLGSKGVQISVLPAVTDKNPDTGATEYTSASVKVVTVQNAPALGPVTIEYDFGRVTVTAADVAVGGTSTGTGTGTGGTGTGNTPAPPVSTPTSPANSGTSSADTGSSGGSTAVATSSSPDTGSLTASTGSTDTSGSGATTGSTDNSTPSISGTDTSSGAGSSPGTSGASGGSVSSGSQLPTSLGAVPSLASTAFQGDSLHGVYLTLVLAAIAAGVAAAVFRHLGVRLTLR